MNAFAEMMLSSLLGWLRGLTQGMWAFFSAGGAGGFFSWIGDHWLALIIGLCILGTLIDLFVWLFRWKPYNAWKRKAHQAIGKINGKEMRPGETWRFNHGYEDSIELLKEVVIDESRPEMLQEEPEMIERRFAEYPENETIAPGGNDSVFQNTGDTGYQRKRRSDRYDTKGKGGLFRRVNAIIGSSDDDQDIVDALPTVIDKNQAFHRPVYPKQKS